MAGALFINKTARQTPLLAPEGVATPYTLDVIWFRIRKWLLRLRHVKWILLLTLLFKRVYLSGCQSGECFRRQHTAVTFWKVIAVRKIRLSTYSSIHHCLIIYDSSIKIKFRLKFKVFLKPILLCWNWIIKFNFHSYKNEHKTKTIISQPHWWLIKRVRYIFAVDYTIFHWI